MMKFFSNGTWQPRSAEIEQIDTPVGERCLACGKAIEADDYGVSMIHMDVPLSSALSGDAYRPWHLACFQRALGIKEEKSQ
jgi:hypothetical protein